MGKSSLLRRMVAGDLPEWPEGIRTILVPQDVSATDPLFKQGETALDCAIKSTVPADEDAPERDIKKRTELALAKLKRMGFGEKRRTQAFNTLSQGWKQRLAVVCAVLSEPDLLLLDEPSDAVDLPGIVKLERFLLEESENRVLVDVSHDESFLSQVATDIIYFDNKKLKVFPGDYLSFVERQKEKEKAMEARVDAADRQRDAAEAFIRKQQNSTDANKQKQAKEKRDKLERVGNYREDGRRYKTNSLKKLSEDFVRLPDKVPDKLVKAKELHFHFPEEPSSRRVGPDVSLLRYDQVTIGYDSNPILKNVTLQLTPKSRVALVGENSSGKSTLMNALCGKPPVKVTGGATSSYPNLIVAYVPQRAGEGLMAREGSATPAELLIKDGIFLSEQDARQHLGRFGLSGKLGVTKISLLSGGQRTRLAIAMACSKSNPNILILDEPSHGLDAPARRALAEALQSFPGALLVSSHDREFIREARFNQLWITTKGSLRCIAARVEEEEEDQLEAFREIFDDYLESL